MNQSYFRFNNKIYREEDGIPMRRPISIILSEIFRQDLENRHFDKLIKKHSIQLLARYVDDIIILIVQIPK